MHNAAKMHAIKISPGATLGSPLFFGPKGAQVRQCYWALAPARTWPRARPAPPRAAAAAGGWPRSCRTWAGPRPLSLVLFASTTTRFTALSTSSLSRDEPMPTIAAHVMRKLARQSPPPRTRKAIWRRKPQTKRKVKPGVTNRNEAGKHHRQSGGGPLIQRELNQPPNDAEDRVFIYDAES
jgi:hypothetical protein